MKRLTKTYSDGTHGASDNLPCGENSYDYKSLLIEKLGKYEDLEERLNKVYGDCDGLLESMIELLEEHSGVDIPDDTVKVLLLANKAVDFYKECEDLDVQDRLIKLPCKIGDELYYADSCYDAVVPVRLNEVIIRFIGINTYSYQYNCCSFDECGDVYEEYEFDNNDFGKTVFLTESEAEAKKMRGEEDGSME